MWPLLLTSEAKGALSPGLPEADELRMAEDFDLRLDRLMKGEPPFGPGEDVPESSRELVELAAMLRELRRVRL